VIDRLEGEGSRTQSERAEHVVLAEVKKKRVGMAGIPGSIAAVGAP